MMSSRYYYICSTWKDFYNIDKIYFILFYRLCFFIFDIEKYFLYSQKYLFFENLNKFVL